ncbi:MAG: response regulator [Ignavibacteriaceae bacterium]|nr:response regulator [Ignavibacteriaceae bacterium]
MKLSGMKIASRLALGFGIIIILMLTGYFTSFSGLDRLRQHTSDLYYHPYTVSTTVRDVEIEILNIRNMILALQVKNLNVSADSTRRAVDSIANLIYLGFETIDRQFLGDKNEVRLALRHFTHWKTIRDEIFDAAEKQDFEKTASLINIKQQSVLGELTDQMSKVSKFASGKAKEFFEGADSYSSSYITILYIIVAAIIALALLIFTVLVNSIRKPLAVFNDGITRIESGDYDYNINLPGKDEISVLAIAFNRMTDSVSRLIKETKYQDWLKSGQNNLNEQIRGEMDIPMLSEKVIVFICEYLKANVGAFYILNKDKEALELSGSYSFLRRKHLNDVIKIKEGIAGQCAYSRKPIQVSSLPDDYFLIASSTGETTPKNVLVFPVLNGEECIAVIELASLRIFSDKDLELLHSVNQIIASSLTSAYDRVALSELLARTQMQAEELEVQQEELRTTNEELTERTEKLKLSEERLKNQQEELEVTNEELQEKNESLQRQKSELEDTRKEIEKKVEQLAIASKYKSEFLANMSHELRTPLNSLLILSRILMENKNGNLSSEETESASVIHKSGTDLLNLINEILDLSKIESGRVDVRNEEINIRELGSELIRNFRHMAEEKKLSFEVIINESIPQFIKSDRQKVEQILKNLISNAVKFTKKGSVTVEMGFEKYSLGKNEHGRKKHELIAISVKDTGIGIPPEKQLIIFEAFQQADGSTSREFGGTGLGLSISRELSRVLGGEILLNSTPGEGSVFTLLLPVKPAEKTAPKAEPVKTEAAVQVKKTIPAAAPDDDRNDINQADKVVVIIEDDPVFAKVLLGECHSKNLKAVTAPNGEEGLHLVNTIKPAAILLDLGLPGMSGWDVLDNLKENPATRHIPVHIITGEDKSIEAFRKGAVGFLTKPVSVEDINSVLSELTQYDGTTTRNLLVIEDDKGLQKGIRKLIEYSDINIDTAMTGEEAIEKLRNNSYGCVILDLGLPDMSGFELLERLEKAAVNVPPIVVYTGKDLSKEEEARLREYAESIIIKGVRSEERLIDEVSLFLHRVVSELPEKQRKMILNLHESDSIFKDKKILIADDDMRNVFALSRYLGEKGIKLLKAEDGRKALELLEKEPDVDLVLMDIMMPVMDGWEAIKKIREQPAFSRLPIIAVTAKAMKKDYEKCIEVGASDYLPKPIDLHRLFSMLRVWLYR